MNLLMMLPEAIDSLNAYHKMVAEGGDPSNVGAFMFLMSPPKNTDIYSVKNGVGEIRVDGTLHNEAAPYYYGTSYLTNSDVIPLFFAIEPTKISCT